MLEDQTRGDSLDEKPEIGFKQGLRSFLAGKNKSPFHQSVTLCPSGLFLNKTCAYTLNSGTASRHGDLYVWSAAESDFGAISGCHLAGSLATLTHQSDSIY